MTQLQLPADIDLTPCGTAMVVGPGPLAQLTGLAGTERAAQRVQPVNSAQSHRICVPQLVQQWCKRAVDGLGR